MNATHTPGPWLLKMYKSFGGAADVLDRLVDANDRTIRFDGVSLSSGKEPEANTRLISVAPEMLDALRRACETIEFEWGVHAGREYRALIAKATGEAS